MTATRVEQITLPGQAAAPPGPVDLGGMYVMHHAFRRDLAAFRAAVLHTPAEDRAAWTALAARWARFAGILHKHHHGEDEGLWPLLLARVDADGDAAGRATLAAMEAEHTEIDPLLRSCAEGFDRLAGHADPDALDALEVRVVALGERLSRHLAHEESEAMALVQRHLTPADWERVGKEHFASAYRPRDIPFMVPWVLAGLSAAERTRIRAAVPRPLAILWRLFWRRPFERRERAAFGYPRA
ncbi:hemerythrin domain-containing protein [Phytohabitans rumicis]|uniref:Hemerythrin-like domain-containing protein n=1 Tax=Phytohabitans rumicis TaxID=1076125 RepID=A0A6V8KNV3_9ACTN|nr:hemerythrin domain-containing protein [Phytohabitans rumicis]GFJ86843.1 hypothetical protein Prum_004850 [Phytohabitans rumicis]